MRKKHIYFMIGIAMSICIMSLSIILKDDNIMDFSYDDEAVSQMVYDVYMENISSEKEFAISINNDLVEDAWKHSETKAIRLGSIDYSVDWTDDRFIGRLNRFKERDTVLIVVELTSDSLILGPLVAYIEAKSMKIVGYGIRL